jgi:hypothetical protein
MAPKGLVFVSAWFDENVERSYRLMETNGRRPRCLTSVKVLRLQAEAARGEWRRRRSARRGVNRTENRGL